MMYKITVAAILLTAIAVSGCIQQAPQLTPTPTVSTPGATPIPTWTPLGSTPTPLPPARLTVSPLSLSLITYPSSQSRQTITVTNTGGKQVAYRFDVRPEEYKHSTATSPFLMSVAAPGGRKIGDVITISPGDKHQLEVSVLAASAASAEPGAYYAELAIYDTGGGFSVSIPITVRLLSTTG